MKIISEAIFEKPSKAWSGTYYECIIRGRMNNVIKVTIHSNSKDSYDKANVSFFNQVSGWNHLYTMPFSETQSPNSINQIQRPKIKSSDYHYDRNYMAKAAGLILDDTFL